MCLGVPGEVVEIVDAAADALPQGIVSFGGVRKAVCMAYVPEAKTGDYVIVHAGFALSILDPVEAARVFEILRRLEPVTAPATGAASHADEVPR